MTLAKRIKAIESIRDVLITADAITCDADLCEPVLYADSTLYHFPSGYSVKVDFNKLATAIYNAGYRTEVRTVTAAKKLIFERNKVMHSLDELIEAGYSIVLSAVGASMKKPILSRFPSRKSSKICTIPMAG